MYFGVAPVEGVASERGPMTLLRRKFGINSDKLVGEVGESDARGVQFASVCFAATLSLEIKACGRGRLLLRHVLGRGDSIFAAVKG